MILDAEKRERAVAHAFVGVIVQIHVRDFDVARRERFRVDAEAVILRGDFDFLRAQILHRMIRAMMAEFQFECLAAERQAAELMAEADAENRDAAEEFLDICDGVRDRFGIAGTIREKDAVRLERENIFGGSFRRDDGDVAAVVDEEAENILLDAVVVGDDAIAAIVLRG